jgi:hypothetical protein
MSAARRQSRFTPASGKTTLRQLYAVANGLENTVVDFPVDDGSITPKNASERLAILLRLGIFAFAGVIIITMFTL